MTQKSYTPEEYFGLEEKAKYKSQYFRGEIFVMTGGSVNHNRISLNVANALNVALRGKTCEAFNSDMKVWITQNGLGTYPDVSVVCGEVEFVQGRNDTITNLILLVEVLSKSTRDYDRGEKFLLYSELPGLQDYVLIDQTKVFIEYFRRAEGDQWLLQRRTRLDQTLKLEAIGVELPLTDIYARVKFPNLRPLTQEEVEIEE